jgi:ubiquinone/menaquinone biosynthesis C-methylase UbiE
MSSQSASPVEIQRRYYKETAERYDHMHAFEGAGDPSVLKYVTALFQSAGVQSVLEVGCATGRGLRSLQDELPDAFVCGLEPVGALLREATKAGDHMQISWIQGVGESLPFADRSFDAVCEFSTLHHVPDPAPVVREMLRVARKVVLIADSNRFGQGSMTARLIKFALYKTGLWRAYWLFRTRGKGYIMDEGDGLAYSYSVYDSYDLVALWADRIILVPANPGNAPSWFHPLLNRDAILLFAFKEVD